MAKGQKRSNREKKKPKATATVKTAAPVAVEPRSFKYDPARIGGKRT
jgi:hypothetical protein